MLSLSGCNTRSAAQEFPQVSSYAIAQEEKTALGDALKSSVAAHPGRSGFRLLVTGSESFSMRLALIEAAEKSLDLQYYSIHDDTTANLLLEALVRAAQRGVRIRFLLDNIGFDEVDEILTALDGFKNIEVRIFNPFVTRDDGPITRLARMATDIGSVNRRMHNKMLIADNQMAILGGRNLGDEYFEENTDVTFRDLDILAAGPVTASISRSFDNYWNSEQAVPVGQLREPPKDGEKAKEIRGRLGDHWQEVMATEKGKKLLRSPLAKRLKNGDVKLVWAKAELAVDAPQKVAKGRAAVKSSPITRLDRLVAKATREFVVVSPYFVPKEDGVEWLATLAARGVKVKIVTNSLASTDVVAAHTGYRPYRRALVEKGIALYEMKPTGGKRPKQRLIGRTAPAHASLHAKAYAVDRRDVMIGSFNLDPRSQSLNTEVALVIHSPELARQVVKMFGEVTEPESSYLLTLEDGELVWKATEKGREVEYRHEPKAGVWRNVEAGVMELLPIEDQL